MEIKYTGNTSLLLWVMRKCLSGILKLCGKIRDCHIMKTHGKAEELKLSQKVKFLSFHFNEYRSNSDRSMQRTIYVFGHGCEKNGHT